MKRLLLGSVVLLALACGRDREAQHAQMTAELRKESGNVNNGGYNTRTSPTANSNGALYDLRNSAEEPSPPTDAISSSAARADATDTTYRFIRTADLRFRVQDVVHATLAIEDLVGAHHGWVAHTSLESNTESEESVPVSADSTLMITRYDLANTMTVRVPNTELDSTLRAIGRWVDVFDHRTITATDVRLGALRNALAVRRDKAHAQRLASAITEQGRKLKETTNAEEALAATEEHRDEALLANMELQDQVAFSTVQLVLYQPLLVRRELVANAQNVDPYRPSLLSRLGHALKAGWQLLTSLLVGAVSIWPVLLMAAVVVWLWRMQLKRPRS